MSSSHIYKSLYDYKSDHDKTLGLRSGDRLLSVDPSDGFDNSKDRSRKVSWLLVQNEKGEIGYVPFNYLTQLDDVSATEELDFIEGCIEVIHIQATSANGRYTQQQRECLQRLIGMRCAVLNGEAKTTPEVKLKRKAPAPPRRNSELSDKDVKVDEEKSIREEDTDRGEVSVNDDCKQRDCDKLDREPTSDSHPNKSQMSNDFPTDKIDVSGSRGAAKLPDISDKLGVELIELVRVKTGSGHASCITAVTSMMSHLATSLPSLFDLFTEIRNLASLNVTTGLEKLESEDGRKISKLIEKLETMKDEGHELNWAITSDEGIILQHINDFTTLLTEADPDVSRYVLRHNKYNIIVALAVYYQMETRANIRSYLLELFSCFCQVEVKVINILVTSLLPPELSRELQANIEDEQRLCQLGYLLKILFSTGDKLPVNHYEYLDEGFVNCLLDTIDRYSDCETETSDMLLSVVLSFNLHFDDDKNIVMKTLTRRNDAKSFTEKIMLLINREDDPVKFSDEVPLQINSVIKLVNDMFGSPLTSRLFYTNDVKVLIDILLRQVSDLSPTDQTRRSYLELIRRVLVNSTFQEHQHRRQDIIDILERINKEDDCSDEDRRIVCVVLHELKLQTEDSRL